MLLSIHKNLGLCHDVIFFFYFTLLPKRKNNNGLDFASHKNKSKFQGSYVHFGGSKGTGGFFSSNFKLWL